MTDKPTERCTCCGRPWRLIDRDAARGFGHGDVCPACVAHAGNPLQEVREHRGQWLALLTDVEGRHGAVVSALTDQVAELRQQLDDRPVREVERVINQDAFTEVTQDMERAFKQRDYAYELFVRLLLVHRLNPERTACICGLTEKQCEAARILEDWRRPIRNWERKQIELFRKDREHRLPANHPAVLDRRLTAENGTIA